MSQHYSEADLLETYYTQPGASMPVMMHLADCAECAAKYERLERKIRALAACDHDQPESFWARQRMSILRRIDRRRGRPVLARIAAAAALAFLLGGTVSWPILKQQPASNPARREAATDLTASTVPDDPWESDQLDDYKPIVAWESWVDTPGGQS
jgi:hypothetical protein